MIVPKLIDSLSSCKNPLLKSIVNNLKNPGLSSISKEILHVVNTDTKYTRSVLHTQTQHAFAIRAGINGLLDVARKIVIL